MSYGKHSFKIRVPVHHVNANYSTGSQRKPRAAVFSHKSIMQKPYKMSKSFTSIDHVSRTVILPFSRGVLLIISPDINSRLFSERSTTSLLSSVHMLVQRRVSIETCVQSQQKQSCSSQMLILASMRCRLLPSLIVQ